MKSKKNKNLSVIFLKVYKNRNIYYVDSASYTNQAINKASDIIDSSDSDSVRVKPFYYPSLNSSGIKGTGIDTTLIKRK